MAECSWNDNGFCDNPNDCSYKITEEEMDALGDITPVWFCGINEDE